MEHIPHAIRLAGGVTAAQEHGAGPLLRIVLAVLLVGAALLAWFLLRGYRADRESGPAEHTADDRPRPGGKRNPDEARNPDAAGTRTEATEAAQGTEETEAAQGTAPDRAVDAAESGHRGRGDRGRP